MDTFSFAIIADPHLCGSDSIQLRHFRAALRDCERAGVSFIVLAGDFTADGRAPSYLRTLKELEDVRVPVRAIRGNNENQGPRDRRFERYFGRASYDFDCGGRRFFVLDTSGGDVAASRLRRLAALRGTARPVVLGHHYLECLPPATRRRVLTALAASGVRRYICAHQHVRRTARFGPVRQDVLTCLDPDKARASLPGYYLVAAGRRGLRITFRPVVLRCDAGDLPRIGFSQVRSDEALEPWIDLCVRFGSDCLQVRMSEARHLPKRREVRRAEREGIGLVAHLPTPRFEGRGRLANRRDMLDCVRWAKDVRARLIVLHPPKLPAAFLFDRRRGMRRTRNVVAMGRALRRVVAACGPVPLAVENNSSKQEECRFGCLPEHLEAFARWVSPQGTPAGYCYDVGHAKAGRHGTLVYRWFGRMGARMLALHLHEGNPVTHATHRPITEPFTTTNWYGILSSAAVYCPRAPLIIEAKSLEDAAASAGTLLDLLRLIGTAHGPRGAVRFCSTSPRPCPAAEGSLEERPVKIADRSE